MLRAHIRVAAVAGLAREAALCEDVQSWMRATRGAQRRGRMRRYCAVLRAIGAPARARAVVAFDRVLAHAPQCARLPVGAARSVQRTGGRASRAAPVIAAVAGMCGFAVVWWAASWLADDVMHLGADQYRMLWGFVCGAAGIGVEWLILRGVERLCGTGGDDAS